MTTDQSAEKNPLVRLGELGQSPWYDYITRDLITSGELARLIAEDGLRGHDLEPDDLREGHRRQPAVRRGDPDAHRRRPERAGDLRAPGRGRRARRLRRVRRRLRGSGGADGLVSLEVSPTLANDTDATIHEAERLWRSLDRPNAMIKIPGTRRGAARDRPLHRGRHQRQRDAAVLGRALRRGDRGVPRRPRAPARGGPAAPADHLGRELLREPGGRQGRPAARPGRATRPAFADRSPSPTPARPTALFEWSLGTPRWERLARAGARPQRPLWASTSTKDPPTPTCTTWRRWWPRARSTRCRPRRSPPTATMAGRRCGSRRASPPRPPGSRRWPTLGIDLAAITRELEIDGVAKFAASYASLLAGIEAKAGALVGH